LHQVGDLFELNVKLRCQKVKEYQSIALKRPGEITNKEHGTIRLNMANAIIVLPVNAAS